MSLRVMVDGKTYRDTDCRKNRKVHRPVPIEDDPRKRWKCAECGESWYWVRQASGRDVRRHYPGTFWVDDSDRGRW